MKQTENTEHDHSMIFPLVIMLINAIIIQCLSKHTQVLNMLLNSPHEEMTAGQRPNYFRRTRSTQIKNCEKSLK